MASARALANPMFTREEASRIKQEFWTVFGKYMNPIPSSEGMKISWVNYHTQIKHVYFRMDAGIKSASIYISLEHPDPAIQELHFHQLVLSKKIFRATLKEQWKWQLHTSIDGKIVSRISKELSNASVMKKEDWPELISFFKSRIIALDSFWENTKYGFDELN